MGHVFNRTPPTFDGDQVHTRELFVGSEDETSLEKGWISPQDEIHHSNPNNVLEASQTLTFIKSKATTPAITMVSASGTKLEP